MDFHILKQQGLSIRQIAALRGVGRNSVRRALRRTSPPTGRRRREGGAKLAPYIDQIAAWLRDPVTSQWSAERIFDELRDRGYEGGRTVRRSTFERRRQEPTKRVAIPAFFVAGSAFSVPMTSYFPT
jgi:transposase